MKERTYLAIDLKSFFASVECVERGLDPLTTNLVVADAARTEKTICLAVSPSLKAYGIPGRPRLFEVVQQVATVNAQRRQQAPGRRLTGTAAAARPRRRLHRCPAPNGQVSCVQLPRLFGLPSPCRPGGYPCLFHR